MGKPDFSAGVVLLLLIIHTNLNFKANGETTVVRYEHPRPGYSYEDHKLKPEVLLKTVTNVTCPTFCWRQCVKEVECKSFGFNSASKSCELYQADHTTSPLQEVNGWMFYARTGFETKAENPCNALTCKNGGRCMDRRADGGTYECGCNVDKYTGTHCETQILKPAWRPWGDYQACSVSCGTGYQLRRRQCYNQANNEALEAGNCTDYPIEIKQCVASPCPVWSNWTEFSDCSSNTRCGRGVRIRSRRCQNGGSVGVDRYCIGVSIESQPCETVSCDDNAAPISLYPNDNFGKGFVRIYDNRAMKHKYVCASGFGAVSGKVVCRSLRLADIADVTAPSSSPAFTDSTAEFAMSSVECVGDEDVLQRCKHGGWMEHSSCPAGKPAYVICKVDGRYTQWSEWGTCSVTCATGIETRKRQCSNPPAANGGKDCEGAAEETRPCTKVPCPVDGDWFPWTTWSTCTVTCGGGTSTRNRTCNAGSFGGKDCVGDAVETKSCETQNCPVDGTWTKWSEWTTCTKTCNSGNQTRQRECTGTAFGGKTCEGDKAESQLCNTQLCPIDGAFSDWSSWSTCNTTCGGGAQERNRKCDSPKPAHGGADCVGGTHEVQACNTDPCPKDGAWNSWGTFSSCTASCGGGLQTRTRTCQGPLDGGEPCHGNNTDTQVCNSSPCPIPGLWLQWSEWSRCSKTCVGGIRTRHRTCNMTSFGSLTDPCIGSDSASESCNGERDCSAVKSCQELKEKGITYDVDIVVDPDGAGGAKPFNVSCDMTSNPTEACTIVHNNITGKGVYAQGMEAAGSLIIPIHYKDGAPSVDINSLTYVSKTCKQFIKYTCHDAGIHFQLNLGLQATYWTNYNGMQMPGWGGRFGMDECACATESGGCGTVQTKEHNVDVVRQASCNCDRNERKEGVSDEGYITEKSRLPIKDVRVGDTGDETEYAWVFVGPLICCGSP